MRLKRDVLTVLVFALVSAVAASVAAGGRVLTIDSVSHPEEVPAGENHVHHRCLTPGPGEGAIDFGLERESRWSLPKQALAPEFLDTINCLVLRFDFQYEATDDPNTTGRGRMILDDPLATPADSAAYFDSVGHFIDPPPHNAAYFDAHMKALSRYWEVVSDEKITLSWDIFPKDPDSVFTLPEQMSHYGQCELDSVVAGLERYFVDCIQTADVDTAIHFSDYQSIFLFHAGSDRQNDIGFPPTCNDLFTGFITFREPLEVDNGDTSVSTAMMMPEYTSQDNRATAMNAVMAHEFGHQLGLVDLYDTRTFMTQLGDFALMDNNGFGTGVDFSLPVGNVFGSIPLFPCAWSRAHLGFVEVHDFRQGTQIEVAAAQMLQGDIKVARIPITEKEYYLLENRLVEYDGEITGVLQDDTTSVIQGPIEVFIVGSDTIRGDFTREYDALMPGSGMLIYHVDESVAAADYNNDGDNNFDDNQLQWDPDRKFITLIEGDGVINFGGFYRAGWGKPEDMYREDRNSSFTPNTNPPTIDNTGNNTRIRITNITRDIDTVGVTLVVHDSLMLFDVETDGLVENFPVRLGMPGFLFSPVTADLNGDGTDEIIAASADRVHAFTTGGENYLQKFFGGPGYPVFYDTAIATVHPGQQHAVPLFADLTGLITANPVVGDFGAADDTLIVAVGFSTGPSSGRVFLVRATDHNGDGLGDFVGLTGGGFLDDWPVAMTFGDRLFILTGEGQILTTADPSLGLTELGTFAPFGDQTQLHGICRAGDGLVLAAGDSSQTIWYTIEPNGSYDSLAVDGYFRYGPVLVDVDRDETPEIVMFSSDGEGVFISIDTTQVPSSPSLSLRRSTGWPVTTNPSVGDIDNDGYPDIVAGSRGQMLGFDRQLTLLTDFPIEVDDNFPNDTVLSTPIVAGASNADPYRVVFPTLVGNVYSYGGGLTYGYPLSAGEAASGSPVMIRDSVSGMIGYHGIDGWFYLWRDDIGSFDFQWPMNGGDATGSLAFDMSVLGEPRQYAEGFREAEFYNYPNPVTDGRTTIRYFLGQQATQVGITIFDLSGKEVANLDGPTDGGVHNEIDWNCGDVAPGVYRCRIEVSFGGGAETAFTDIAVIR